MSVKTIVKTTAQRLGFLPEPPRAAEQHGPDTMAAGLQRCAARGIEIASVIDVGAAHGSWSRRARRAYPDAQYLLVEAQAIHAEQLDAFTAQHASTQYVLAAAGDRDGTIYFDATCPDGGLASERPLHDGYVAVPVRRLDTLVAERGLAPPYLVKLDTHGYEVPILAGAPQTLARAELLVIEAYNFVLTDGCLRFHELIAYLEQRGFRCIDVVDVLRRPKDQCLWQFDLFFARATRPEFQSNVFEADDAV